MIKFKKNFDAANLLMPILVGMLLLGILSFLTNSVKMVSERNKNNFAYTIKVRNTIKEIDKIVERAEINVTTTHNIITETYDINKLYDKQYNIEYINNIDLLVKSILKNTPGVNGAWFQSNISLPFANDAYSWYAFKDGQLVNYRDILIKEKVQDRDITPESDPYYFEAVETKDIVWSDLYTDPDSKVKMLTISQPIYKHNKLIGVFGIDISTSDLQQALKNMQAVVDDSEIYLLDKNNELLLYQMPAQKINKNKIPSLIKLFQSSKAEDLVQYTEGTVKKTAIKVKLTNKYNIVMSFHNAQLFKGYERLFRTIYLIFIIMTILAVVMILNKRKISKMNKLLENEAVKLRTVIDASPNTIVIKNLNGTYIDCNEAFTNLIQMTRRDIIGKSAKDILNEEKTKEIKDEEDYVIKSKKMLIKEFCFTDNTGKNICLEKYIIPLLTYKKELKGILIIAFDISKQKEEQEILKNAKETAEKAVAMKSNFLANMSHEIRTPMNGVLGFLQLLKETETTPEQEEFIDDALRSSELLLQIINDILDFSKMEANKLQIDEISFNINTIIEDVTINAATLAQNKNVEVNSFICSDVTKNLMGDPIRIKQILSNIISNAVKFTQEGEVIVTVSQIEESDETCILNFDIKDTGIGIVKEKLDLIFEEFSQADTTTTRKFGGTGLGLAITKKLVDLMGGNITVDSKPNKGSIFTVTLPLKKDINASENNYINLLNNLKILIIDSSQTNLKILEHYLNRANCEIVKADSEEKALKIADSKNNDFSVVIIDEKMENEETGKISTLLKSNEKFRAIPFVLCTALSNLADFIPDRENGFAECVSKPTKKNDLIMAVAKAIYNPESEKEKIFRYKNPNSETFNKDSKILIAEDNEINIKLTERILSNYGITCDVARNGEDAVKAFKANRYDLIFMDCQMPIMSGYEATEAIRELERGKKHTPIVAMTANVLAKDEEKCYETGMDDYISKPMKIDAIFKILNKYLEKTKNDNYLPQKKNREASKIINTIISDLEFTGEEAESIFIEYLMTLPRYISVAETAIEDNNTEELIKTIHKLKGASANLRVEKIASICNEIENKAEGTDKKAYIKLINEIKAYSEILSS